MVKHEEIKSKYKLMCQNCGEIAYHNHEFMGGNWCVCGKRTTKFTEDYQLVEENDTIYLEATKKQEDGSVNMLGYYSRKDNLYVHDRETSELHILISFDNGLRLIVKVKPKYVLYPQEGDQKTCVKIVDDVDFSDVLLSDMKLSTKLTVEGLEGFLGLKAEK